MHAIVTMLHNMSEVNLLTCISSLDFKQTCESQKITSLRSAEKVKSSFECDTSSCDTGV